jgi:hypothetical protein
MLVMAGHAWTATLTTGSQRQALLRLYVQGSTCYKLETHRMSLLATFFDTSLLATCASLCCTNISLPLSIRFLPSLYIVSDLHGFLSCNRKYIYLTKLHTTKIFTQALQCVIDVWRRNYFYS